MHLYPVPHIEWSIAVAARAARCAVSGLPIKAGDEVYEPERGDRIVLVREYHRYIRAHASIRSFLRPVLLR